MFEERPINVASLVLIHEDRDYHVLTYTKRKVGQ